MIKLNIPQHVSDFISSINLTANELQVAINNRHRGLADENVTRVAAVHWISENRIIFIDGIVSLKKANHKDGTIKIVELTASLVLLLQPQLPNGLISRSMRMVDILVTIADSFGYPVTASLDRPYSKLYSGYWNGEAISFLEPTPQVEFVVCGTFNTDNKYANMLWACNIDAYREWLTTSSIFSV